MVMYLGLPVEQGDKEVIFKKPLHPYTRALLASTPHVDKSARMDKKQITGELPSPLDPPSGCTFHKRCLYMTDVCMTKRPEIRFVEDRMVACHNVEKLMAS